MKSKLEASRNNIIFLMIIIITIIKYEYSEAHFRRCLIKWALKTRLSS